MSDRGLKHTRELPQVAAVLDGYTRPAILVGLDHRILAANPAYREIYGGGREPARKRCHEVSHHSSVPCDLAGESCPLRNSLDSGEPQRALHVHHTPRGEEHVDVETRPVRDHQGRIRYFVEILSPVRVASAQAGKGRLVGRSGPFTGMLGLVQRVAPSESAVLLLGESGTGKEAVAEAIHAASGRAGSPFVPLECSGLTEALFESELFGHEKGAFTGAHTRKVGLVEAARGGTLFLDEIGDIPLPLQVKLLRLLETGAYRRVGSADQQRADFRLICATHRDLRDMVVTGNFRQDLFYRISAFPIQVPALRDRSEDLSLLVQALLRRLDPQRRLALHPRAFACLNEYSFPGNIRELLNILQRASLLADGETIMPNHLPDECRRIESAESEEPIVPLATAQKRYLRQVLTLHRGDKRALARKLGISERTLYRKLRGLEE